MKKTLLGSIVLASLLIIGCGEPEGISAISKQALQAQGLEGAPSWVLDPYSKDRKNKEEVMYASASAPIVANNINFARNEALAKARVDLAQQVAVSIKDTINSTAARVDASISEKVIQKSLQAVEQTLAGTRQADTWLNNDGSRIYVLVQLTPTLQEKIKKLVKQEVKNSGASAALQQALEQDLNNAF